MELLSEIIIPGQNGEEKSIKLLQGDLTQISKEFAVDILAVSAFRGSYEPIQGTLMGALFNAGLSVEELAENKEVDLTDQLSCWLSKSLNKAQQARFNFKKILCFEPATVAKDIETQVGNLFRGINTFAIDENHDEIAMPILATGNQKFLLEVMLSKLLDTALFWFENSLPLKSLNFVLHTDEQVKKGLPLFENVRKQYDLVKAAEDGSISAKIALEGIDKLNSETPKECSLPKMEYSLLEMNKKDSEAYQASTKSRGFSYDSPSTSKPQKYDFFISYSHKYSAAVQEFVNALYAKNPEYSIFYDRDSIPSGGLWLKMISDAIENSKNVVCILTPEYSKSDVCWDEFLCAKLMVNRKKSQLRMVNFCNDDNMPVIMAIHSYIDCTEADLEKLKDAVEHLID